MGSSASEAIEVLLIEDSLEIAERITRLLNSGGSQSEPSTSLRIHHCRSFKHGLKYMRKDEPDLVFVDLGLPDSCGIKNYDRIRGEFPDCMVVILVDKLSASLKIEIKARHADGVVETKHDEAIADLSTRLGEMF